MVEDSDAPASFLIAEQLLRIGAVILRPDEPFTWASGLQSPIYCDNRLTMAYPEVRRLITDGFVDKLKESGLFPDVVAGTATAGIPHAAWLAERLSLPLAYVRSKAKEHGKGNQIEGIVQPGQNVVVIEDLISTGMSSLAVVRAIQAAGAKILACMSIFSYDLEEAVQAFDRAGVRMDSLTRFDELVQVATQSGQFDHRAGLVLRSWRENPVAWSEARSRGQGYSE